MRQAPLGACFHLENYMAMPERLERAINRNLARSVPNWLSEVSEYSCDAVCYDLSFEKAEETLDFLHSLGMRTDSIRQFEDIPRGPQRQYARALWLTWAALMAKEWGIK